MKARALALALALAVTQATACEFVAFTVEVASHQARAGHSLHAVGNLPALGPWQAQGGNRFEPQPDGRWRLRLRLPPDTAFEFKLLELGPGERPIWESHQLTPTNNRHARSPQCGAAGAVSIASFEQQPDPWEAMRRATPFVDQPLTNPLPTGVQALIDALASPDDAMRRAHLQAAVNATALPLDALHRQLDQLMAQTGGLRVVGRRHYEGLDRSMWVLMARGRHFDQALPVLLRLDEVGRLHGLRLPVSALRVTAPAEPPLSRELLRRQANALVTRACRAGVFSGAVEVAQKGRSLLRRACGTANRRYGVPNRLNTRFNLASVNKMFTAVAVLQLAEQGRLSLDDPLDRHLGEQWLASQHAKRITLGHLLAHRSGLGSYFEDAFFQASRDRFSALADYSSLLKDAEPDFTPGESFSYSNTGYLLLGAVLEQSGQGDYFAQVQRRVFDPSGMAQAGYEPMNVPVPHLAMHYMRGEDGRWVETTWMHVYRGGPAGGGYASVGDLTRFAAALSGGKLLGAATLAQAWPRDGRLYGLGFELGYASAGFVVGHSGGFPGINAQLDIYPQSGFSVAVLANLEGGGASQLALRLGELIARLRR